MTAVLIAATLALGQPGPAAETPGEPMTETERIAAFVELARENAATYEMQIDEPDGPTLELREEPVLKWSNPVRGELYGGVFVWTHRGRPEVIAAIFKWYSPFTHMTHEIVSLSEGPIRGQQPGKGLWSTSKPGLEFAPIPEAPEPAASAAGRLLQMRRLARRFEASAVKDEGPVSLRLMTQPLLRYSVEGEADRDGAIFTFVEGTDPEVLLLLESRPSPSGPRWEFACARLNFIPLRVEHGDRLLWEVDALESTSINRHREPYTKYIIGKVRRITEE